MSGVAATPTAASPTTSRAWRSLSSPGRGGGDQRTIETLARLDYPAERLRVNVAGDASTDDTPCHQRLLG